MLVGQTLVCPYGLDKLKFVLRLLWYFTFGREYLAHVTLSEAKSRYNFDLKSEVIGSENRLG